VAIAGARGTPERRSDVGCLFERGGELLWRHREGTIVDSRPARSLVLRWMATVGNYDYVFDWVFQQDGSIRGAVGATGIAEAKGVASRTVADDADGRDGAYGHFVSEHTVAPNHDHFFVYRLDLDVDGTNNSLVVDSLQKKRLPEGDYDFVELVERGRPDWLASACRQGVRCDVLVISGHFDGMTEFYSDRLAMRESWQEPVQPASKVSRRQHTTHALHLRKSRRQEIVAPGLPCLTVGVVAPSG
jgi:Cu2+-containing amine oxidase